MEACTAEDLFNALQNGCLVVDCRGKAEYAVAHVASAALAEDAEADLETPDDQRVVVLYGHGGAPSDAAASLAVMRALARVRDKFRGAARLPTLWWCCATSQEVLASFPFCGSPVPLSPLDGPGPSFPSVVAPGVFLGSALHAASETVFRGLRLARVLNVAKEVPNAFEGGPLGVRYINLPWVDAEDQPIDCAAAAEAVQEAVAAGEPLLVHCFQGMSRSAAAAACWLVAHRGLDADAAHAHLRRARSIVRINAGFLAQLHAFATTVAAARAGGAAVAACVGGAGR